jgi:hypothetical protein
LEAEWYVGGDFRGFDHYPTITKHPSLEGTSARQEDLDEGLKQQIGNPIERTSKKN